MSNISAISAVSSNKRLDGKVAIITGGASGIGAAGIIDGIFTSILDTSKSDLERLLAVNLVGPLLGAKHAARVMIPRKRGCILFTASACVSIAGLGTHAYTATKCGASGLTRNLSAELGEHGIRVNCVSPYAVANTGIGKGMVSKEEALKSQRLLHDVSNLKGKLLTTEDIAQAALYLASDEAGYISGINLVVDGGFSVVNPIMMRAFAQPLAK